MTKTIEVKDYAQLLKAVRGEIELGRRELTRRYWNIGGHISRHLLHFKERADYGKHLFERLSADLDIGARTLYRATQFFAAYPILTKSTKLTWSHFTALASVTDFFQRKQLEKEVVEKGLGVDALEEKVKKIKSKSVGAAAEAKEIPQLKVERGRLGIFQISDPQEEGPGQAALSVDSTATLRVDCGFSILREVPLKNQTRFKPGTVVEAPASGSGFSLKKVDAGAKELYTYTARLIRVIDGDTIKVVVNCGLGTKTRQTLRLRLIDAPEIDTPEGKRAKAFVQSALKSLPFVVIKTYKPDKFDRYLVDVFYDVQERDPILVAQKGKLLNQELLTAGLARLYCHPGGGGGGC